LKKFSKHQKTYKLLNEILPDFDSTYSATAIIECKSMEKKINSFLPFIENKESEIEGVEGTSYFKINFKEPVIQFVPNELQHFRQFFESRTFHEDQEQYVYSFVPSYIPNINHLTLHISYGENLSAEASVNKNRDSFNKFVWEQKYIPMSIDTLNRFLKESSQKQDGISNENTMEKIRMCFEYCFWNLPDVESDGKVINFNTQKGFGFIDRQELGKDNLFFHKSSTIDDLSVGDDVQFDLGRNTKGESAINVKKDVKKANRSLIHNFVYDRPKSIVDIIAVRKTIAKIDELSDSDESIELVHSTTPVKTRRAKVTFLTDSGDKFETKTKQMHVTKNTLDGLDDGDLINCIIAKSISPEKHKNSFSRYVVVGKIGKKISFDLKHFVSLYAWKKLQKIDDGKSLCTMGTVSEFKKGVAELIEKIDFDMLKFIENDKILNTALDSAIENLFPLFVIKDNIVYHNPPSLISHIANFYPDALQNKEMITDIGMLFDIFLNNYHEWGPSAQMKLRTSEIFEKIQLEPNKIIDINHFASSIPLIAKRIIYSRLYSQHWKQWLSMSD